MPGSNKTRDLEVLIPYSNGKIDPSAIPWGSGGSANDVTSVAGRIGDVVLNADDISETVGKKFLTDVERAKLVGIAAGAEVNVQSDWDAVSGDTLIQNKPTIPSTLSELTNDNDTVIDAAYVQTENSYTTAEKNKLSGIAASAEVNVQSDWDAVSGDEQILNKPTNVTVGADGFMSKEDKQKIDSIDLDYQVKSDWDEAVSSDPSFILNKPTIPTTTGELTNNAGFLSSITWSNVTGKPTFATVATSGSYSDLSNKPTIPTNTSALFNDSGFISDANYVSTDKNFTAAFESKLQAIEAGAQVNVKADWDEAVASHDAYIQNKPTVPTLISELTNDSNYITDPLGYTHTANDFTTILKDKLDSLTAGGEPNIQADWTETNTGLDSYIVNKPVLATVATTGDYDDLINKPAAGDTDTKQIKVSASDTTEGYAATKVIGGTGITVSVGSGGGDERLIITSDEVASATTFLGLTDTPVSYTADRFLITNGAGDAVEFLSAGLENLSDATTVGVVDGDVLMYQTDTFVPVNFADAGTF